MYSTLRTDFQNWYGNNCQDLEFHASLTANDWTTRSKGIVLVMSCRLTQLLTLQCLSQIQFNLIFSKGFQMIAVDVKSFKHSQWNPEASVVTTGIW